MNGIDKIQIEVLADGTIKSTTDEISSANHKQAEDFFKLLATLTGGETKRERNLKSKVHYHHHQEGTLNA